MAAAVLGDMVSKAHAALVYGVSPKFVSRWAERFRVSSRARIIDRSSRPASSSRLADGGVSPATVSRVLRRAGLSRMKDIDPSEPVVRYEYAAPGGLIHLDIKRLGRFERVGHPITGDRTGQSNSCGGG